MRWLTAFALTVVGAVTLIGNRIHAAGNDAVFTQSLVNRAARFGGTYYQNGITPKGPLEDVAHDIALRRRRLRRALLRDLDHGRDQRAR